MTCTCGQEVNPRGQAAHLRGNAHLVGETRATFVAKGWVAVDRRYADWFEAAGIAYEIAPLNWHQGGIGRKGTLTHACYVLAAFAEIVKMWQTNPGARRAALKALGALEPAAVREWLTAAKAAIALDLDDDKALEMLAGATP